MKAHITQREAKELFCTQFGYCEIYNLLRYETPVYYTSGLYGRKADYYRIENPKTGEEFWISTGYAPTGAKPTAPYKKIKEQEKKSEQRARGFGNTPEQKRNKNRIVLYRLCFSQWKKSTKTK